MTTFPIELMISDAISLVFLPIGAFFLIKFFLKFGSEKTRFYSVSMCLLIISYAVVHEGIEILHGFGMLDGHILLFILTMSFATFYFITSLLLKKEMLKLLTSFKGGKNHGR
jgi:hypothetical protein